MRILSVIAGMVVLTGMISAQERSRPQARKGSAERSLLGIALFDTGLKVINRFGSPDEIQALAIGGGGGGAPAGGGAGPAGAPVGAGAPMGGMGGGRGGAAGAPSGAGEPTLSSEIPMTVSQALPGFIGNPFGTPQTSMQGGPPPGFRAPQGPPGGFGGPSGGSTGGYGPPGNTGNPTGGRGMAGGGRGGDDPGMGGRGGAGAFGGGGASSRVTVTRWVYNRGLSRYAFILDKFNRVIQIEAVGLKDARVGTRRGVKFGSTFSSLIKAYSAPDGYEIAGNNVVVRYLVMDRVAFRLQKLDPKKPHVVTGIVVAAGKI